MKTKLFFTSFLCLLTLVSFSQADSTFAIKQEAITTPDSTEWSFVEEKPVFPGGEEALHKFISDNIKYPKAEKKKRIEGTVYVRFMVEKDGSITNIHIVKEVQNAPGFSEEVLRVMKLMPAWTPGKLNGRPQRYEITQPVKFAYKKKE
jgi:protein TonB